MFPLQFLEVCQAFLEHDKQHSLKGLRVGGRMRKGIQKASLRHSGFTHVFLIYLHLNQLCIALLHAEKKTQKYK